MQFFSEPQKITTMKSSEKCSRTFITFTDERTFKETFHHKKIKPPVRQYCPITRQPAKFFDPVTQTPYANGYAFKFIRDAYKQQVECEKSGDGEAKKRSR